MIPNIKKLIPLDNPFRLMYHKLRGIIANYMYSFPSKRMVIIGITGTNGKTTTTNLIAKGLKEAGNKVFMFSTINIMMGDKEYVNNSKMTSPDVFVLQKLLKQAKNEGCKVAVIETSSHSILQSRNYGLNYDIAVLTNITQDHLDLHKTMENYVNTKLQLFRNLITYKRKPGVKKVAIINNESDYKDLFLAETYDNIYLYGKESTSTLRVENIKNNYDNTTFDVKIAGNKFDITTKLRGEFNIYNILAAIGVFISFGLKPEKIKEIISGINGVAGRIEEIPNNNNNKIFVDYAHTPDALIQVLDTIREIEGIKRIITVFGATGDRDTTKRPIMGKIVSEKSDVVILTQDDDYTESIQKILKDVIPGIERKEGENFWIITNRKEAIRTAIIMAEKNDAILIAGKGDEHIMMTNNGAIDWHDRNVIEEILKEYDEYRIID